MELFIVIIPIIAAQHGRTVPVTYHWIPYPWIPYPTEVYGMVKVGFSRMQYGYGYDTVRPRWVQESEE